MQPEQDMPMPGEEDNESDNFGPHKDEASRLKEQDIEGDHKDLGKSSDTRSHGRDSLLEHIFQDGLLESDSSSSLREVGFLIISWTMH